MRAVYSFGVNDPKLVEAINAFKDNGGNLSKLICNLLEHYFFGGNNKEIITKEMLKLLEIEKRLNEFYEWAEKITPEIQELKQRLEKKQEQEKIKDELPLIRELQLTVFTDDLAKTPEEFFKRFEGRDNDLRRSVKVLLSNWASEKQLSYPEAVNLFFKAFPQLKEKLEGRL
ncbi:MULTISPECIES: hypothetical protein [unclassified Archaeoglobus]|uniref:hypothetical protein n=1 Tax=unclassified Archaeoglobus TaxID=2643606 RepID=UPI0025C57DCB|nr:MULTISPECIES: hypothetical protein [unclassified Archaeoglobus]